MSAEPRRALTPTLEVAYEQTGPETGDPVLLLHGWPYSPRSFDAVTARLSAERSDLRLIVPYLRGFGPTHYRSSETPRSGQQAALGKDIVDLLDALALRRATLVGYDWGSRAACVAAALWPDRVRALVTANGYTIQDIAKSSITPQDPEQEHQLWYQWYFQTERGRAGFAAHRNEIARKLWSLWSPSWHIDDSGFKATAAAFQNPDFVDTTIHSYRHRYGNAPGDPALEAYEQQLAMQPRIAAPTIALQGEDDRVAPQRHSRFEGRFTGFAELRMLPGVGHCIPQEAPEAVVPAILDALKHSR